jgi:zinc protease
MIVVIVGGIDAKQAVKLLRDEFLSLVAHGSARDVPPIGEVKNPVEPAVLTVADPVGGFRFNIIKVDHRAPKPVTWGDQLEGLRLKISFGMLSARLNKLTQGNNPVLSGASTEVDVEFRRFRKLTVSVSSSPDDWKKCLAVTEQEIRRVAEHGFTVAELTTTATALRNAFQDSVQSVATSSSSEICDQLLDSVEDGMPFSFSDESIDNLLSMLEQITPENCQSAFRKYWGVRPPYVFITTAAQFIPARETVREIYAASEKVPVEAIVPEAATTFQYHEFGATGAVVAKTHVPDLDLWLVEFANGVRLNLKHTGFERGLVRFHVRIGTGKLGEPRDQPGLSQWTGAWLLGGVGKHSIGDISRMVDGANSVDARSDDDALTVEGSAHSRNLSLALQEITAFVIDPAFRAEGFHQMATALHTQLDPLWNTPEGPVQRFMWPALAGNDPRIGLPDPSAIFARTPEQLRDWLTPQLGHGAIEIALVGDLDVDTTIVACAQTLGALPPRSPKPSMESRRKLTFSTKPVSERYYYGGPASRPSTLEFFWPVHDPLNATECRRLPMLALILQERVNDQVREKKGATYSSRAAFSNSETYAGLAGIRCTLEVSPDKAVKYGDAVRALADKLARKGITDDELDRAKAQYSAAMKGWLTDNNFWLTNVLAKAQEDPTQLTNVRSASSDIDQTTVADLSQLARKYLGANRVFRYIIDPSARIPKKK